MDAFPPIPTLSSTLRTFLMSLEYASLRIVDLRLELISTATAEFLVYCFMLLTYVYLDMSL